MSVDKTHIKHCILFEFKKGHSIEVALKSIKEVYGEDAIDEKTMKVWYDRFQSGNFALEGDFRMARTSSVDPEQLKQILLERCDSIRSHDGTYIID